MDDVLTDNEVREFGLPTHVPGADCKDSVEWGTRSQAVSLECSNCGNRITRTLSVPEGVSVGEQIKFSCGACNAPFQFSRTSRSIHRTRPAIGAKAASPKRLGRPPKSRPENGEVEPQSESIGDTPTPLVVGLAGTLSDSLEFLAA
jgi:hypothetical protein